MAIPPRRTLLTEMRLENERAAEVKRILSASAKRISADLSKLGGAGEPFSRMQLRAQLKAINAALEQDFKEIQKTIAAGKIAAAQAASAVVSEYEDELYRAVMSKEAAQRIARSEANRTVSGLEAAIKRMEGTSYKTLSQRVYKTRQLSSGWVSDIVNQALASGWDAKKLAKEVAGSIDPNVRGGVSYAANRLARTEINNAYHAASAQRYLDSPIVDMVDWSLSTSHPEGDICDKLAEEGPYPKDKVPEKPHPNCYCYITPRLPTREEFIERLLRGDYGRVLNSN